MILLYIFYIIFSLFLLWKGSEWLVESSVRIAKRVGIPQLVIGLTIVAFGTSAPEFVVTVGAAVKGQSNISVSNIIGSNIFNLGFILGGIAVIHSIESSRKLIRRDALVLFATTVIVLIFLWNAHFTRIEGLILFIGLIGYNLFLLLEKEEVDVSIKYVHSKLFDGLILIGSIGFVVVGGYFLRVGAVGIARIIGISEWVIGATVIAAGTSAPEFATSLVASLRGHHGISAGNLVGSCIYNSLGVLGLAGLIRPMTVSISARGTSIMLLVLVLFAIIALRTGWKVSRKEGIVLFAGSLLIWIVEFM